MSKYYIILRDKNKKKKNHSLTLSMFSVQILRIKTDETVLGSLLPIQYTVFDSRVSIIVLLNRISTKWRTLKIIARNWLSSCFACHRYVWTACFKQSLPRINPTINFLLLFYNDANYFYIMRIDTRRVWHQVRRVHRTF